MQLALFDTERKLTTLSCVFEGQSVTTMVIENGRELERHMWRSGYLLTDVDRIREIASRIHPEPHLDIVATESQARTFREMWEVDEDVD